MSLKAELAGPSALNGVICVGGTGFGAAAAGAGAGGSAPDGYDFGVDPNLDPELAMALRASMQEERSRQEAAAASSDAAAPAAAEGECFGRYLVSLQMPDAAMPSQAERDARLQCWLLIFLIFNTR